MKSDWSVFGSGKGSWERKRELLSRSMARYWWWWRWRWWWWWHLYYPKVNLFSINFIFDFIFTFLQLDRDIKALKFDLNVTDVTLQSSVSALLFDVNHVNQTLKDQVCWENYLNVPQDVKLGVLTICVNHPGVNLVHKHKTRKSHSVEEWPASRTKKSSQITSPQITAQIFLSFPPPPQKNGANHLFFPSQFPVFQCNW